MTPFNAIEQEAIVLNAIWDMIDDLVNFRVFVRPESFVDTNLLFQTTSEARLFSILLVDFLSQPQRRGKDPRPFDLPDPPIDARASDLTYLFYLRRVCDDPHLGKDTRALREGLTSIADWLEADAVVPDVWLPSIDTKLDLRVPRISFLKICGDISKHNFARLEVNVRRIERILADNGHPVAEGVGYSVLDEFYEWFHRDIFAYHASTIAESLNTLRWAIYDYLSEEFARAFVRGGEQRYRFDVPPAITQPLAREMYWDLMNRCRSRPSFPVFSVTPYLKLRY